MKFEYSSTYNWENAFRGMRHPLESYAKSDSQFSGNCVLLGENDLNLAQRLIAAGSPHDKFMRQIFVSVDITAPLFWWKEADTYKVGTTANSTSFMHKGLAQQFSVDQFEAGFTITNQDLFHDVESDIPADCEIWKKIDGYEDYSISNTGKIMFDGKTVIDIFGKKREYAPHIVAQCVNSSNYKKVVLRNENGSKNFYVHRLMAQAFIPNPENLPEVNHIDGNKWNNNISNLEWCSVSENSKHAFANNLREISAYNKYKVKQNASKLNDLDILAIQVLVDRGIQKKEIAKLFGVYDSVICDLTNGKSYNGNDFLLNSKYVDTFKIVVDTLNGLREAYLIEEDPIKKKEIWKNIVCLLPESWLQTRTWTANYEVLRNIYFQRQGHKLTEWHSFCKWVESLPYAKELITYTNKEN